MSKRILKILRICLGVALGIAGIALAIQLIPAIPRFSQFSAYQLGGLTSSLLAAILAFALAWQCVKRRP
jgi:hypothetical protein